MALVSPGSYTAIATVTNTSTRAGQPAAAVFTIICMSFMGELNMPSAVYDGLSFGAGQTRVISYPFQVPNLPSGTFGELQIWVQVGPGIWGAILAYAEEMLVMT